MISKVTEDSLFTGKYYWQKMSSLIDDALLPECRTIRAAIDNLVSRGRPSRVSLAVLVDRGRQRIADPSRLCWKRTFQQVDQREIIVEMTELDGQDRILIEVIE